MNPLSWFRRRPVPPTAEPVAPPREVLEAITEEYDRHAVDISETLRELDCPGVPVYRYDFADPPQGAPSAVSSSVPLGRDQLALAEDLLRAMRGATARPFVPVSSCACFACGRGDAVCEREAGGLTETSFAGTVKAVEAAEAVWLDALAVEVDTLGVSPWDAAWRVFGGAAATRDATETGLSRSPAGEPAGSVPA